MAPAPDDRAEAVWLAHGMVMQGGVLHCVESLSTAELDAAIDGYREFRLGAVADVLEEARGLPDHLQLDSEARFNAAYGALIPDDQTLADAIDLVVGSPIAPALNEAEGADPIAAAIRQFIESSIQAARLSTVSGQTHAQHRAAAQTDDAVIKLLRQWDSGGHAALVRLLRHSEAEVRLAAAGFLCEGDPDLAIPVLAGLTNDKSLIGLEAGMVLQEHKRGAFKPLSRLRSRG